MIFHLCFLLFYIKILFYSYQGTEYKLHILTTTAFNLLSLIPNRPKMDLLKVIKSPMPGLVKSVSCKVGDKVNEGQELCVVGEFLKFI